MSRGPLITQYAVGSALAVELHGEIDLARTDDLRDALHHAIALAPRRLVVDLSATTFLDSAGLGVLVGAHHKARHHGIDMVLAGAHGVVARLLAITGVGTKVVHYLDCEAAMSQPLGREAVPVDASTVDVGIPQNPAVTDRAAADERHQDE